MNRILLIEQNNIMKMRLEKIVENTGFSEVVSYQNNFFSFKNAISKMGIVNTVIMDYDQYNDEFDSFVVALGEVFTEPKVKIVLLTSKTEAKDIMTFYRKGVDEVVLKPFTDEILVKKLTSNRNRVSSNDEIMVKKTIMSGNNQMSWRTEFEIGVEQIDHEHKAIIDHFARLYDLMKEGQGHEYFYELMAFLKHYVETHFDHEEDLQKQLAYPSFEAHKMLHDRFKAQVERMMNDYHEGDVSNSDLVKLNMFVKEWLIMHILVEDKKLGLFILNQSADRD